MRPAGSARAPGCRSHRGPPAPHRHGPAARGAASPQRRRSAAGLTAIDRGAHRSAEGIRVEPERWRRENLAAIRRRLEWLRGEPDGTLHDERTSLHHIRVIKHAGQVQLYFVEPDGQLAGPMSRIELDRPLHLVAGYTQAAVLGLLWNPAPQRVCVLGFAGGRLP